MNTRLFKRFKRVSTFFVTVLLVVAPLGLAFSEAPQLPSVPLLPTPPTTVVNTTLLTTAPELPPLPTAPSLPGATTTTTVAGVGSNQPEPAIDSASPEEPPVSEACPVSESSATEGNANGEIVSADSGSLSVSAGTSVESNVENENTGAQSNNGATVLDGNLIAIDTENKAEVDNGLIVSSNTGENDANYNTGSGSVKTGDSNIILSILNMINTTFVALPGGEIKVLFKNIAGNLFGNYLVDPNSGETYTLTGSRVSAENQNTGAGSTNSAIINTNNSTVLSNNNDANVGNNYDIESNTGDNDASYNTGNGSITTGDSNVSLNLLNFLNSTFTASDVGLVGVLNIFGNWLGDLLIPKNLASGLASSGSGGGSILVGNSNTGFDSNNLATASTSNALDVNNDNNAEVLNNISITNNTGDNTSGYNTGSGSIQTGDVNTQLNVGNLINQNLIGDTIFFFIVNVAGEWSGSNLLSPYLGIVNSGCDGVNTCNLAASNNNTGAESDNTATINTSNSLDINNTNSGALSNNIKIDANTGDNKADYNTGNGLISTGDSNILANIANIMNVNVVAKKFVFLVVNVFGDWNGNIDVQRDQLTNTTETTRVVIEVPAEIHITTVPTTVNLYKYFAPKEANASSQNLASENNFDTESDDSAIVLSANTNDSNGINSVLGTNISNAANDSNGIFATMNKYKMQILAFLTIVYLSFLSVYFNRKKKRGI